MGFIENRWFSGFVLPVLVVLVVALWKQLPKRQWPQGEDRSVGFDLLMAAATTALAFLAEAVKNGFTWSNDIEVRLDVWLISLSLLVGFVLSVVLTLFAEPIAQGDYAPPSWGVGGSNFAGGSLFALVLVAEIYANVLRT